MAQTYLADFHGVTASLSRNLDESKQQLVVTCADCHGGDPTSDRMGIAMDRTKGFIGTPSREQTVGICGSCHADPERSRP